MIALDASALLAYLFREKGHERVRDCLNEACLSAVTMAEVIGRFVMDGHDASTILQRLVASPLEIVPFTQVDSALTATLLPQTRKLGLSLGDRACLSLAIARNKPALTADRTWLKVGLGIKIEVIR